MLRARPDGLPGHPLGKNPGDVWRLAAANFRGAHFATFPPALVERPLLATCPERVCTACGHPWKRKSSAVVRIGQAMPTRRSKHVRRHRGRWQTVRQLGALEGCGCNAVTVPGVVLDPFFGSGTVGVVAERLGRDWIGIELNADYADLARSRLEQQTPNRVAA